MFGDSAREFWAGLVLWKSFVDGKIIEGMAFLYFVVSKWIGRRICSICLSRILFLCRTVVFDIGLTVTFTPTLIHCKPI